MDRTEYAADIVHCTHIVAWYTPKHMPVKCSHVLLKYQEQCVQVSCSGRWWKCMDRTRYAADIIPIQ